MHMSQRIRTVASAMSIFFVGSALSAGAGQVAGEQKVGDQKATVISGPASPSERHALIEALLAKWGPYVQSTFGADVNVWRDRLTMRFMNADATNLREALQRDTYDSVLATLIGRGHLAGGADVSRASTADEDVTSPTAGKFGDLNQDLVYTPLAPCRILDTRSTGAGAIAANSTRNFVAINAGNFTSQGGSATNCGTLGLSATAVAINLTAVTPAGAGYATAYPFGTTQPLAASVNYSASAIVNNALIVQIPNPLSSFDFTVYTFAQSHYVADTSPRRLRPHSSASRQRTLTSPLRAVAAPETLLRLSAQPGTRRPRPTARRPAG